MIWFSRWLIGILGMPRRCWRKVASVRDAIPTSGLIVTNLTTNFPQVCRTGPKRKLPRLNYKEQMATVTFLIFTGRLFKPLLLIAATQLPSLPRPAIRSQWILFAYLWVHIMNKVLTSKSLEPYTVRDTSAIYLAAHIHTTFRKNITDWHCHRLKVAWIGQSSCHI